MSALVEFLLARIGEEENAAKIAAGVPEAAMNLTRWHSTHVLADCEARRRIVELHAPLDCEGVTVCSECGPDEDVRFRVEAYGRGWPCLTMRVLAQVYADHPDYREEWRP